MSRKRRDNYSVTSYDPTHSLVSNGLPERGHRERRAWGDYETRARRGKKLRP